MNEVRCIDLSVPRMRSSRCGVLRWHWSTSTLQPFSCFCFRPQSSHGDSISFKRSRKLHRVLAMRKTCAVSNFWFYIMRTFTSIGFFAASSSEAPSSSNGFIGLSSSWYFSTPCAWQSNITTSRNGSPNSCVST